MQGTSFKLMTDSRLWLKIRIQISLPIQWTLLRLHIEMFPQHREVTRQLLDDLIDLMTFAFHGNHYSLATTSEIHALCRTDSKTSITSTAPYEPAKMKEILEVLKEVRGIITLKYLCYFQLMYARGQLGEVMGRVCGLSVRECILFGLVITLRSIFSAAHEYFQCDLPCIRRR